MIGLRGRFKEALLVDDVDACCLLYWCTVGGELHEWLSL